MVVVLCNDCTHGACIRLSVQQSCNNNGVRCVDSCSVLIISGGELNSHAIAMSDQIGSDFLGGGGTGARAHPSVVGRDVAGFGGTLSRNHCFCISVLARKVILCSSKRYRLTAPYRLGCSRVLRVTGRCCHTGLRGTGERCTRCGASCLSGRCACYAFSLRRAIRRLVGTVPLMFVLCKRGRRRLSALVRGYGTCALRLMGIFPLSARRRGRRFRLLRHSCVRTHCGSGFIMPGRIMSTLIPGISLLFGVMRSIYHGRFSCCGRRDGGRLPGREKWGFGSLLSSVLSGFRRRRISGA